MRRYVRLLCLVIGLMSHHTIFAGSGWHGYPLVTSNTSTNHNSGEALEVSFEAELLFSLIRLFASVSATL